MLNPMPLFVINLMFYHIVLILLIYLLHYNPSDYYKDIALFIVFWDIFNKSLGYFCVDGCARSCRNPNRAPTMENVG